MSEEKGKFEVEGVDAAMKAALDAVEKRSPEGSELQKEVDRLKAQLEMAQSRGKEILENLKQEHDRALRAAADLDNQKKRAQREKEEATKFGIERLLKEILPVADNLERALGTPDAEKGNAGFFMGVKMTAKLLEDILGKQGVKAFSAKGQVFDPRLHEAMQQVETDGPSGQVAEEFLRGYMLNDRLVRPALVAVSRQRTPPPAPAPAAAEVAPAAPESAPEPTPSAPTAEAGPAEPAAPDAPTTDGAPA